MSARSIKSAFNTRDTGFAVNASNIEYMGGFARATLLNFAAHERRYPQLPPMLFADASHSGVERLVEPGGHGRYSAGMAFERITVDPARMRGLPCIRGTRVTVSAVLGQLAAGRSVEQLLDYYPYLEREDVLAALEYAAAAAQERELPLIPSG
jgi:uncharacterized protein (DUF433 family)